MEETEPGNEGITEQGGTEDRQVGKGLVPFRTVAGEQGAAGDEPLPYLDERGGRDPAALPADIAGRRGTGPRPTLDDAVAADTNASGTSPDATSGEAQLRAEMAEMERRMVVSHRRALLAENAGRVVPELIAGSTVEELEASVEAATAAYAAVRDSTLAQVAASARVSATNGARSGGAADVEAMSALEKIAHGLRREG